MVGQRVKLKKAGREWRGLSPFNAEKTPSFYVNDQKQFYHDFSSGKNGNIFDFLMETEGLTFPEAVERLAGEAGLDLPRRGRPVGRARARGAGGLHEVLAMAADFFERNLNEPLGARARAYLADRPHRRRRAARVPARLRAGGEVRAARGAWRPRASTRSR